MNDKALEICRENGVLWLLRGVSYSSTKGNSGQKEHQKQVHELAHCQQATSQEKPHASANVRWKTEYISLAEFFSYIHAMLLSDWLSHQNRS